jgi:hypothetical protein
MISKLMAAVVHPATKAKIFETLIHVFATILAVFISTLVLVPMLEGYRILGWLGNFGVSPASWLVFRESFLSGIVFTFVLSSVIFVALLGIKLLFMGRLELFLFHAAFLAAVYIICLPFLAMSVLSGFLMVTVGLPTKLLMTAFGMPDYEALKIVLASAIVWPTLWLVSKLHKKFRR